MVRDDGQGAGRSAVARAPAGSNICSMWPC